MTTCDIRRIWPKCTASRCPTRRSPRSPTCSSTRSARGRPGRSATPLMNRPPPAYRSLDGPVAEPPNDSYQRCAMSITNVDRRLGLAVRTRGTATLPGRRVRSWIVPHRSGPTRSGGGVWNPGHVDQFASVRWTVGLLAVVVGRCDHRHLEPCSAGSGTARPEPSRRSVSTYLTT
jgi:hypothetical protein